MFDVPFKEVVGESDRCFGLRSFRGSQAGRVRVGVAIEVRIGMCSFRSDEGFLFA